jgi:hypothetical protein
MSTMTETSLADMKAGFPPAPEPIQGIHNLQSLIELLFHLCCCTQTHHSPASASMNLLLCAAPWDVYAFLTSEASPDAFAPFPPKASDVPNFTRCTDENDCTTVRATHARANKMRADIITMNTALADVFLEAMSVQVRTSFQQCCLRKPNIIFVDLFLWFIEQYGKTTAKDCKANQQCMATNRHPTDGFDALIFHLFTGAAYANSTGYKMNDVDAVNIGLHLIKRCGMYAEEYKVWIAWEAIRPKVIKTFDTFKTFWAAKITLVNQTTIPTSLDGYGIAAVNNNDASRISYGELFANFGAAYAATQE